MKYGWQFDKYIHWQSFGRLMNVYQFNHADLHRVEFDVDSRWHDVQHTSNKSTHNRLFGKHFENTFLANWTASVLWFEYEGRSIFYGFCGFGIFYCQTLPVDECSQTKRFQRTTNRSLWNFCRKFIKGRNRRVFIGNFIDAEELVFTWNPFEKQSFSR